MASLSLRSLSSATRVANGVSSVGAQNASATALVVPSHTKADDQYFTNKRVVIAGAWQATCGADERPNREGRPSRRPLS